MISASSLPGAVRCGAVRCGAVRCGAARRKSSYSSDNGGDCLEAADNLSRAIPVCDSKNPTGPVLIVTPGAWSSFVPAVQRGELRG